MSWHPQSPSPCSAGRLLSPCQSCPRRALGFSADGWPPFPPRLPSPRPHPGFPPLSRLPVSVSQLLTPASVGEAGVCHPLALGARPASEFRFYQPEVYSAARVLFPLGSGASSRWVIVVSGRGRGWVLSPASSPKPAGQRPGQGPAGAPHVPLLFELVPGVCSGKGRPGGREPRPLFQ